MRNFLFVTVGLSAISARNINDPRQEQLLELLPRLKSATDSEWILARLKLIEWHQGLWKMHNQDAPELIRHTSSELLTTAKILHQLSAFPSLNVDRIVFLASKTRDGQLAAEVNKAVMESAEYQRVAQVPPVAIESIPAPSSDSVGTLSDCILKAVNKHRESENDRVIFNITAGFGGVSTLIGMQAVYYGYRICYQHETMQQPIYIGQTLKAYTSPIPWTIS